MKWKSFGRRDYCINIQDVLLLICYLCAKYVTGFAKTGLTPAYVIVAIALFRRLSKFCRFSF